MKNVMLLLLAIQLGKTSFGQPNPIVISGSQTRTITSNFVKGQVYNLQISLPAGYATSNKKYPVVYLMDSQWDFPLVTALYGQQYFDGFIPEMVIVGITWGGDNPNPDSLRARDYTPTNEQRLIQSGGADAFLSFIKNEVFPFVENNYKVDKNDRTLMGCSLGGLFTLYTLFTQPTLFNRYITASPAYMWDKSVLYQYEKNYFNNKSNPPAKLFICVGGVETSVPGFETFTQFLKDRHYSNLQIESRVLENTGHSGTKGEGYARGLQFAFKSASLQLPSAIVQPYVGKYKLDDGQTINISTENGALVYTIDNTRLKLFAASETDFYVSSFFFKIHFLKNQKGLVSGFQLNRYGTSDTANKTNQ